MSILLCGTWHTKPYEQTDVVFIDPISKFSIRLPVNEQTGVYEVLLEPAKYVLASHDMTQSLPFEIVGGGVANMTYEQLLSAILIPDTIINT